MGRAARTPQAIALRDYILYLYRQNTDLGIRKANDNIETKTLNKLCSVLQCKLEDIAEFADYYGVSVDYLIGRTSIKKPYPKK